jgi:glycerol-3-phosphate dehydrogenase
MMKRDFSQLHNQHYDLLVCGGGIYGAWTAYDAALRGLRVALVDQGDWAGGTSSASSKLIHGGLRYLETYDFKLVRKALNERNMLLAAAPHRVWPLRFGVPVFADSRVGTLQLKAGLTLYDWLGGTLWDKFSHHHFNRRTFAQHFPMLAETGLQGGYTYADAQTDDARLVLELVAGAMAAGAVCVNYCKLTGLVETEGLATGAKLEDRFGHAQTEVSARKIVYSSGQWHSTSGEGRSWCRLAKGVHLVLPGLHCAEALLLTAPADGRIFFIIPWYGQTLLGTTDTDYRGDLQHIRVEAHEIDYLLQAANHYLKTPWTHADVINSYAGVRVLKQDTQSSSAAPSAVSRDWELKSTNNGVYYSIGGKITSAREDAASIVDAVCAQLGKTAPCATRGKSFPWAPAGDYTDWLAAAHARAAELGIDPESTLWLLRRHGQQAGEILDAIAMAPQQARRIVPELPLLEADLLYCAQHEMVVHLDDLLRRRLPLLILARLSAAQLHTLAGSVGGVLDWDMATQQREAEICAQRWLPQ